MSAQAPQMVEVVAIARGYYRGCVVDEGTKFLFDVGQSLAGAPARPLPRWVLRTDDPRLHEIGSQHGVTLSHDTKPADARAAASHKASSINALAEGRGSPYRVE